MTLLVPTNGAADALGYFVARAMPEHLMLRLFVNNVTPAETDDADAFAEASGGGYAPIELTGDGWAEPVEGMPTKISYSEQQTFSFTESPGTIYGYFMTRALSGRIAVAERISNPFAVSSDGGDFSITPSISGGSA